ncbi:hypothetical protein ACFQ3Z_44055 [Streptomyces nogalater]
MKRTIWATVVTAMTAVALGAAIPAYADTPPSTATAAEAATDPVDPPLYDQTAGGGKVRVNVVTETLADVADAATAGETKQHFETVPVVTLKVDRPASTGSPRSRAWSASPRTRWSRRPWTRASRSSAVTTPSRRARRVRARRSPSWTPASRPATRS